MKRVFNELPIGAVFVFPAGVERDDGELSKPGDIRCVKVAPRGYRPLDCTADDPIVPVINYRTADVFQPRLQPGPFGPLMGLRAWVREYKRLVQELEIYRHYARVRTRYQRADDNYRDRLRQERDSAAARVVGYGEQLTDELLMIATRD